MVSARDTVLQLEVHLGNGVFWEYRGVRDITCETCVLANLPRFTSGDEHTNCRRFYYITDCEALDCLVFRSAARAVGASHGFRVTACAGWLVSAATVEVVSTLYLQLCHSISIV